MQVVPAHAVVSMCAHVYVCVCVCTCACVVVRVCVRMWSCECVYVLPQFVIPGRHRYYGVVTHQSVAEALTNLWQRHPDTCISLYTLKSA